MKVIVACAVLSVLAACSQSPRPGPAGERPQDEVPAERSLPGGDRQYGFRNGCIIVLEATRAVVKSEGQVCELYQRDIALLYAAGD